MPVCGPSRYATEYYYKEYRWLIERRRLPSPRTSSDEVDRAARARGESRSRFISRILRLAMRARRDAEITRRLDALFANEPLAEEQRREAEDLGGLAVDWSDEHW